MIQIFVSFQIKLYSFFEIKNFVYKSKSRLFGNHLIFDTYLIKTIIQKLRSNEVTSCLVFLSNINTNRSTFRQAHQYFIFDLNFCNNIHG